MSSWPRRRRWLGGLLSRPSPPAPSHLGADPDHESTTLYGSTPALSLPHKRSLPPHWAAPTGPVLGDAFQWLCLVSVGAPDLRQVWEDIHQPKSTEFEISQEKMRDRVSTVTVVVSLESGRDG